MTTFEDIIQKVREEFSEVAQEQVLFELEQLVVRFEGHAKRSDQARRFLLKQ